MGFNFCDLKLVPIDSALNFASENLIIFLENLGVVQGRAAKLEDLGLKFPGTSFVTNGSKIGKL